MTDILKSDVGRDQQVAIIYFGHVFLTDSYVAVPKGFIAEVTMSDLLGRHDFLYKFLAKSMRSNIKKPRIPLKGKLDHLHELHLVETILLDRITTARYSNRTNKVKIFISHSSKDKVFARWLSTDLQNSGHEPWLDEWTISVGESIPQKISEGIKDAEFVIVILSQESVKSRWVEREWQTKYWDEVSNGRIHVLPVLFQDCEIPELMKTKKYADFRNGYNEGLEDLLEAIDRLSKKHEKPSEINEKKQILTSLAEAFKDIPKLPEDFMADGHEQDLLQEYEDIDELWIAPPSNPKSP